MNKMNDKIGYDITVGDTRKPKTIHIPMRQNDTQTNLTFYLKYEMERSKANIPYPTFEHTAKFQMKKWGATTLKINKACDMGSPQDKKAGKVVYQFENDDLSETGNFDAQIRLTKTPTGGIITSIDRIIVQVEPKVD